MNDSKIIKGRVSVLVPCYNAEEYIQRCLNSIILQTWNDIELIVVNDGSTDETDNIIKSNYLKLSKALSRFIYIKQKNNGVGSAMNTALKYFTGEFLAPFDSDDFMMQNSIEVRAKWLISHPETSVVQNNGYYVSDENFYNCSNKFSDVENIIEDIQLFDLLIDGKSYNWPGSYMIRSSAWLASCPNREIYPSRSGQNLQLILPSAYNKRCDYIPDCLMRYRVHVGSLSNTQEKTEHQLINDVLGYKDIYIKVLKDIMPDKIYNDYLKRIENTFDKRILKIKLEMGNINEAKEIYSNLEKKGYLSVDDKIMYYYAINKALYYFYRLKRKLFFYKKSLFNS